MDKAHRPYSDPNPPFGTQTRTVHVEYWHLRGWPVMGEFKVKALERGRAVLSESTVLPQLLTPPDPGAAGLEPAFRA